MLCRKYSPITEPSPDCLSVGLELVVRITHKALVTMAATVIAVNILLPQLIPVFSKIATAVGTLVSAPTGLKAAATGILSVIYYAYA